MLDLVKIKNCWTILRFYGYDQDLQLSVSEDEGDVGELRAFHSVTLSPQFVYFLRGLFDTFSSNKYWLNRSDLRAVFRVVNDCHLEEFLACFPFFEDEELKLNFEDWKVFWVFFYNQRLK
jgi:hypothetical protein